MIVKGFSPTDSPVLNKVIEADTGLYHQWDVILRAKETKVKRFQNKKPVIGVEYTV